MKGLRVRYAQMGEHQRTPAYGARRRRAKVRAGMARIERVPDLPYRARTEEPVCHALDEVTGEAEETRRAGDTVKNVAADCRASGSECQPCAADRAASVRGR